MDEHRAHRRWQAMEPRRQPRGEDRAVALRELAQKLNLLMDTIATEQGHEFTYPDVRAALAARGHKLSRTSWHFMLTGTGRLPSNDDLLREIADVFGVDREYLVPGSSEVPARITAQLEAVRKLRAAKVKQFATRTLGDMSPEALAAIEKILDEDSNSKNRP
jgi:hypothetical protein